MSRFVANLRQLFTSSDYFQLLSFFLIFYQFQLVSVLVNQT